MFVIVFQLWHLNNILVSKEISLCIDNQGGDYEFLLLDLQNVEKRPYLKMINPRVGIYHLEGPLSNFIKNLNAEIK